MIDATTLVRSPAFAELKITYRKPKPRKAVAPAPQAPFTTPLVAVNYLREVWNPGTLELIEDFLVVCLDQAFVPLGWVRLATGAMDRAIVDPRLVFGVALQTGSAAILVAHNHPSGNVEPSDEDRSITKRLADAGRLLNMPLLDHIILSKTSWFSLADAGQM